MTYTRPVRRATAGDPVHTLMSWPVAVVQDTDTLLEAARELTADEIGAVLVLHDGALVGVLSERDIAGQFAVEADGSLLTAGEVMTPDLVTVSPEAPILEAARIMREAQVRHLPVLSEGQIAGMLSIRDVFHVLLGDDENRN